ncbi:ubiquilin-1-like [Anolis carolinensis]|uniref:ubiquilin-1-like n=1 Tax=Anolis carolinensis TaxID=28377 RepID=UPI002F2B796B
MMVESQKVPDLGVSSEPQVVRMLMKTPWQMEEFMVHKAMSVRELKAHVARHFAASSPDQVELVYAGKVLKDHKTLGQYAIQLDDGALVHVVIRSQRGGPPTPRAPSSAFTQDCLRELTASLGSNTAKFEAFQSRLMSQPEVMLQLLENPFIQSKLSSPDLMKELVTNSPQEVQQAMQWSPETRHFLTSPEGLRLVVELAKHPAALREILRPNPPPAGPPGSLPGGQNNNSSGGSLHGTFSEVQGFMPRRPTPCNGNHDEKPNRMRERLSPRNPWPPKAASGGNDHSRGESHGITRGEAGPLVKSLLHQIIKHLLQNMVSSPSRMATSGQAARSAAGSRASREQGASHVPALLQQIQSMDLLLANWSPKEIQGLLDIQQRLQALATDELPATERRGRSERPARRAHSITSLCDRVALPDPHSTGQQDFSTAQRILQTLVGSGVPTGPRPTGHQRGSSAQPSAKQKRTYKL